MPLRCFKYVISLAGKSVGGKKDSARLVAFSEGDDVRERREGDAHSPQASKSWIHSINRSIK